MGWGARQWLRATKEETYGVYDSSSPSEMWVRLVGGNPFPMRQAPQRMVIRSCDGGNRRRQVVASRKVLAGSMSTLFYPTQAAFFLDAACTLTGEDLPSYTLDYFDTVSIHRFLGCKVASLLATGSATQDYIPMSIAWVGGQEGTLGTFAKPADTVFPTEVPFVHIESKGNLSIGGVVSKYSSLSFTVRNTLHSAWDEDQFISNLYYCGRDFDLSLRMQFLTTAMRDAFNAQSPLVIGAAWDRAGGLTASFDLKDLSYVASLDEDLPLDGAAYQTINIESFFDQTATPEGTDFTFTVA